MFYLQKIQNQIKVSSCDRIQDSYEVSANFLLYLDPGGDCKSMFMSINLIEEFIFYLFTFKYTCCTLLKNLFQIIKCMTTKINIQRSL